MAHTSPFHRRKWAGYISASRILIAVAVLFIVPFGGEWRIPSPWDGELSIPVTGVLVGAAIVFALLAVFVKEGGRTVLLVLTIASLALGFIFDWDQWRLGGVDDITLNGYFILFVLTALAPITDVLDGHFARKYPRVYDEDFFIWPGRNADGSVNVNDGKAENDMPNAFFFILVPAALTIRFFLEQLFNWDSRLDSDMLFWVWLVASAVLLLGTLLFNAVKANAVADQAVTAEVLQGWLAGLFYFAIPVQFAFLAFSHWWLVSQIVIGALFAVGSLALVLLTQDRWFDRPESDYSDDPDDPRRVRY